VATLAALSPAAAASHAPRAGSGVSARAQQTASGARLWFRRYSGPKNGLDQASSVAVSRDGTRVFVTGTSEGRNTGGDYATVAYSTATGKSLWVRRYNGLGNGWDSANSMAVSRTRVFVTGYSYGRKTSYDYATVAYSAATGRQLWVRRYNSSGKRADVAWSLAVNAAGTRVFVTGSSGTVAYSAATGGRLWVRRGGSGSSVAVNRRGTVVFVTGSSRTVAYSVATGRQLWVISGGPSSSVALNRRGTAVFVTGYSWDPTGEAAEYATVAYSASTGRQLWASYYIRPGDDYDMASSVAVNPGGTAVFVTGYSGVYDGAEDYATVAYDAATGTQLWVRRYGAPEWNEGYAASFLAVSTDGTRVYITGQSAGYATVAYSAATGRKLWARHYNPPGKAGAPSSIAVSPRGTAVFVTGTSPWRVPVTDYGTVAYRS
jgi:outer membrane protein assembly factor BamB